MAFIYINTHTKINIQALRRQFETAAQDAAQLPGLKAENARLAARLAEEAGAAASLKQVCVSVFFSCGDRFDWD
jgi:hypothetical protein